MTRYLIIGASRGLGEVLHRTVPVVGDRCWLVSRSEPALRLADGVTRTWIRADLTERASADVIAQAIEAEPLDVVIYNAGIWEDEAFSPDYRFEDVSDEEDARVLAVNLTTAIPVLKRLIPALRRGVRPKIVLIGSVNGLPYVNAPEVAYNASKFGLRGVAHALRTGLRRDRIAVTILNPGSFGVPRFVDGQLINATGGDADACIPPQDLATLVRAIVSLSNATVVRELDVMAMEDPW
ncbi:MAG: SDR family oxidoreductase [Anaerolineales bacterium]|nr:SDR family oxidoreductase [Anaerolineales bacterium]